MEGQVGEDLVWLFWEVDIQKIIFNNSDVDDGAPCEIDTELDGGFVVWFDGYDVFDAVSESASNDTRTGADFDDSVAPFKIGVANQDER